MAEHAGEQKKRVFSRRGFIRGSAVGAGVAVSADAAFISGLAVAAENPVTVENARPGTDDDWDVYADRSIEGFSTRHSVNAGETIEFKIQTESTSYEINIYRIGWYGGKGARKVATVIPSVPLPQIQPEPYFDADTKTTDCGNWAVSASWQVPSTAVSGVYVANLDRTDANGRNRILFVVRNDGRVSDLLVHTADTTYQAYNDWGGFGLYTGAQKVSYNRPYEPQEIENEFFYGELPLVRWLERNGYDVAYCGAADTDSRPAELMSRKVFVSSGHDEYWSGAMRQNVEAARDSGVNLIFMTGNEVFWKVRWENSLAGPAIPHRTLVCYKETLAHAKTDPSPEWTGTWRDPRFSPPSNGGRPENALTGTLFKAINPNADTDFAIKVPATYSQLRIWRNTSIASLQPNQTAVLAPETLGYEWNTDADNGHRPAGLIRLSETTETATQVLQDFGGTYIEAPLTHYLTMYRAASGALVWSTGTVQWSWGLDDYHLTNPNPPAPADLRMQQATLNVLADMDAQPATRQAGLVNASKSSDNTPPTSTITSPAPGVEVPVGSSVTVTGTAFDTGGVVAGVEVSIDGGTTWRAAIGTTSWSFTFTLADAGEVVIASRAIDDSCNIEVNGPQRTLVGLSRPTPLSIWPEGTVPAVASSGDPNPYELGVKFRASQPGFVTAIRFFKGAGNTGQHVGHIWNRAGGLLGSATFIDESNTGWQTAMLDEPVPVAAGVTYIASYTAPNGNYALDASGLTEPFDLAPLRALGAGDDGPNGVFGAPGRFPAQSYGSSNYWVDIIFDDDDGHIPTVVDNHPAANVSSVDIDSVVTATLSEPVQQSSVQMVLTDGEGAIVPSDVVYDPETRTVTLTPQALLVPRATYSATVSGAVDHAGNAMAGPVEWSFSTAGAPGELPTSIWTSSSIPQVDSAADYSGIEVGLRFRSSIDAHATAVRFYKGPGNLGTHVGRLWSATGVLLGTAAFHAESGSGWQEAKFPEPIPIDRNSIYVVSYHAPNGGYALTSGAFSDTGVSRGPLEALSNAEANGNGVFNYNTGGGYPSVAYLAANYWVDVVIDTIPDVLPPEVLNVIPAPDLQSVSPTEPILVEFDEVVDLQTIDFDVRDPAGSAVSGDVTSAGETSVAFVPTSPLELNATYTASIRATDLLGHEMPDPVSWAFTTIAAPGGTPASVFDTSSVPAVPTAADSSAVEVGMRFTSNSAGLITAIRFYKGVGNVGQHIGRIWSASGEMLGSVAFDRETRAGWQQANLATPVPIEAGQTYVVSYHAPNGGYSHTAHGFDAGFDSPPLTGLPNNASSRNGVYAYGPGDFPSNSHQGANYFVDVVFADNVGPQVAEQIPSSGATAIDPTTPVTLRFSEPIRESSLEVELRDSGGAMVPVQVTLISTSEALVEPTAPLAYQATYTIMVLGVEDISGNAMVNPYSGSFSTQSAPLLSLFGSTIPAVASANDPSAVELGMKFQVSVPSEVVGVRFYQGPTNVGPHVGRLYDANGVLLAEAPFGNDGNGGWRFVEFSQPVPISPNTTYVVAYFTESGNFAIEGGYFNDAVSNGPIVGLASGSTWGNGVFAYGGGYPTSSYNAANYWVDVAIRPTG